MLAHITRPRYTAIIMTRMVGGEFLDLPSVVYDSLRAGQSLNNLLLVYLDGQYWLPSAPQTPATVPARGVTMQSAASGAVISVLTLGIVSNAAWALASGQPAFLGSGSLAIASAPTASGNWVQRVGIGVFANVLDFRPEISPFQIGQ